MLVDWMQVETTPEDVIVPGDSGHPTILIVHEDREFQDLLSRNLQQNGYLVLEAHNAVDTLNLAVRHSRPIHLLLADDTDQSRAMAATLKPYRPDVQVLYIGSNVELSAVLLEIFRVLDPPPKQKKKRKNSND